MNSKRLNNDSEVSHALVQDTRTGEVYDVKTDSYKSCTGTYLNYKKISEEVVLQNGDLIAFKDQSKTWDFVYKFCLLSNPNKTLRSEERDSMLEEYERLKITMEQLKDQLIEVEVARKKILDDFNAKADELKKLVNIAIELNRNLKNEIIEDICSGNDWLELVDQMLYIDVDPAARTLLYLAVAYGRHWPPD